MKIQEKNLKCLFPKSPIKRLLIHAVRSFGISASAIRNVLSFRLASLALRHRRRHGNSRIPAITTTSAQMLSRPENLPSVVRRMTAGQMLLDGASVGGGRRATASLDSDREALSGHREGGRARSAAEDGRRRTLLGPRPGGARMDRLGAARLGARSMASKATRGPTRACARSIEQRYGVRFSRVYIWQIATKLGLGHLLSKSRR